MHGNHIITVSLKSFTEKRPVEAKAVMKMDHGEESLIDKCLHTILRDCQSTIPQTRMARKVGATFSWRERKVRRLTIIANNTLHM
jgi:hypothetical protein